MVGWTCRRFASDEDRSGESAEGLSWSGVEPSAICAASSLAHLAGKDALGHRVQRVTSLDALEASTLQGKVVVLTLSDSSPSPESYLSRVREELYSLCDSRLRPFCSSTHRPYPLRDLKRDETLVREVGRPESVSLAIVDAGSFIEGAGGRDPARQSALLNDALSRIISAEPSLVIVCSDGCHWVEEVYGGHARVRRGDILPLLMFSSRMSFSKASSADRIAHGAQLLRDHPLSLLQGRAMLQLGVQRERNAQSDYDVALDHGVSVVEYLYLLGFWRNAMTGREVSPLEHVFDHLDKMSSLGWSKEAIGMHVAFSLDVVASSGDETFSESGPFGCSMKDLGATLTYLGRTGFCRVLHIMGPTRSKLEALHAARMVGALIYKLVLLREEYSGT